MASDLLEVGSEAVHVLVVGQHGVSLGLEEVDVPDAQNSQQDGHVALQRSAAEVFVLQRREEVSADDIQCMKHETGSGSPTEHVLRLRVLWDKHETAADNIHVFNRSINIILPSSELLQEAAQSFQSLKHKHTNRSEVM